MLQSETDQGLLSNEYLLLQSYEEYLSITDFRNMLEGYGLSDSAIKVLVKWYFPTEA